MWTTAQEAAWSPGPSPVHLRMMAGPHVEASFGERHYVQQEGRRSLAESWKAESGGFANLEWAGRFG